LLCLIRIPLQRQFQLRRSELSVARVPWLGSGLLVLLRVIDHQQTPVIADSESDSMHDRPATLTSKGE
jgi:hypothetical protein